MNRFNKSTQGSAWKQLRIVNLGIWEERARQQGALMITFFTADSRSVAFRFTATARESFASASHA